MAATIIKAPIMGTRTTNRIKKAWDKLEGRSNHLDYDRAKLLHEVWDRLQRNDKNLAAFMVNVLGEYGGKRSLAFVRLVHAFEADSTESTWTKVGGKAMVLLGRVSPRRRAAIIRKVNETLKRTGRKTVTIGTTRAIAQEVLGADAYRKALSEPHGRSSLSAELALLKHFILELLGKHPDIKREMPKNIQKALGLDVLARQSG